MTRDYPSIRILATALFVIGKSRVAPLKNISLPRKELTAAATTAKVAVLIREELPASSSLCNYPQLQEFFCSDSNIVLGYINNDSRSFKAFVANRADFITENTSRQNWKHVGTKENVADYASRGIKAKEFHSEHPWLKGPAFLWQQNEVWNPSSEHSKLETFNLSEDDPDTQENKSSLSYFVPFEFTFVFVHTCFCL